MDTSRWSKLCIWVKSIRGEYLPPSGIEHERPGGRQSDQWYLRHCPLCADERRKTSCHVRYCSQENPESIWYHQRSVLRRPELERVDESHPLRKSGLYGNIQIPGCETWPCFADRQKDTVCGNREDRLQHREEVAERSLTLRRIWR